MPLPPLNIRIAAALGLIAGGLIAGGICAAPAGAQTANPPPKTQEQITPVPQGPIAGGQDIQPKADQVPGASPNPRLKDDPQLRQLYEGVMKDSDPSSYRKKREHI